MSEGIPGIYEWYMKVYQVYMSEGIPGIYNQ